jgi:H+/gluconate symporter-like permease
MDLFQKRWLNERLRRGGSKRRLGLEAPNYLVVGIRESVLEETTVLHRVASMASGGMDTLPHNGAVITLLAVTGLTHRQSYGDIFAITCTKTAAVFVVIGFYYLTGIT